jgi:hypothetical protein
MRKVETDKDKQALKDAVDSWTKPVWVETTYEEPDRSDMQRKLAEAWYTDIYQQSENERSYERNYYRLTYGVPILLASDLKKSQEFRDSWNHGLVHYDYESRLRAMGIVRIMSLMSVKEATGYLREIEQDVNTRGLVLHVREEYEQAMG